MKHLLGLALRLYPPLTPLDAVHPEQLNGARTAQAMALVNLKRALI